MGKGSKLIKDRTCWFCKKIFKITAKEIKAHAQNCKKINEVKGRFK